MTSKDRVAIRIEPELRNRIFKAAHENYTTTSEYIRRALIAALEDRSKVAKHKRQQIAA